MPRNGRSARAGAASAGFFSGKGKEARSSLAAAAGRVTVGTRSLKKSNRAKPKKRQSPDFDKAGKQEADMRKQSVFERSGDRFA
jgi:hypothetical protein